MRRISLAVAILALTVTAGAQAPTVNKLGVTRFLGRQSETTGNVTHLTDAVVWLGNVRVAADEAFVNLTTSEIEFRGTTKMTATR